VWGSVAHCTQHTHSRSLCLDICCPFLLGASCAMSEQIGAISPLFMACQLGRLSLATALLDHGATVNIAKVSEWEYCGVGCTGMVGRRPGRCGEELHPLQPALPPQPPPCTCLPGSV
jgi:hypothetical protein